MEKRQNKAIFKQNKPQKVSKSKIQNNRQEKETNPLRTLFEKMRPNQTPQEQRQNYMDQALEMMEGKLAVLVNSPVQARIIELICKKGSADQRQRIFAELEGSLVGMLSSKYSRFTAIELLAGGKTPEAKEIIESQVIPQAAKLLKNAISNISLNALFSAASNDTRNMILNQILLRQPDPGAFFAEEQLAANPALTQLIIANVRAPLAVAEGKMMLGSITCIHVLLRCFHILFFLQNNQKSTQATLMLDFLHFLQEIEVQQFNQLIDTPEGAELASYVYALQLPKTKKQIIQALRPKMTEIWLKDKNAASFLISTIFQTDDVILIKQNVIDSLSKVANQLLYGNVFLFPVPMLMISQFQRVISGDGRCRKCVNEAILKIISNCERMTQCKKDPGKRQIQLAAIISQFLHSKNCFTIDNIAAALQDRNNCIVEALEEIVSIQQVNDPEYEKSIQEIAVIQKSIVSTIVPNKQQLSAMFEEKQQKRLQKVFTLVDSIQ